ncbi:twin-arginine translocase TatA/TatE family subunit [Methanolobus sediminis]|uniref:Twin-arginine translocase TatA/TatE family subunit n=1 Tax=Methanolobus sediminis TaxID=3072978 RepID=A0AA51UKM2_9EURY|nr:twin-arginine translocase TatA/TatE family subunit [Methanolobus sediminis]WMW25140.1 twin-arginine translocase TatA/TatE family subunit [Methanolobus sediminis]
MIGSLEIVVILVAALLIFGPDKIPELARAAGQAWGDFHKAQLSAELGLSDLDINPAKVANEPEPDEMDNKIRHIAESAGIDVQGKSTEELLSLMEEAAKAK